MSTFQRKLIFLSIIATLYQVHSLATYSRPSDNYDLKIENDLINRLQNSDDITYNELELLAEALWKLDSQVHRAQNIINRIKRDRIGRFYSRIHYNYYDDTVTPDYYEDSRKHSHHHRSRSHHRKKHHSSSDSDSGSDSDTDSREYVKPARFEVVSHKKRPSQPPAQPPPPPPPLVQAETDVSFDQSEEPTTVKTVKAKTKDPDDRFEYMQSPFRKIRNKGRRAGMRLDYFLPKRFHWKEEDLPKLGYLWFNGPTGSG